MFWLAIVLFVGVALCFGVIGAVIGRITVRRGARSLEPIAFDAPSVERQAIVYLEVAVAWHSYLRAVRTLVYPEEGPPATGTRDLASVLRARAQLQNVATPVVQELHDQVLDSAVTLIDLLRSHVNPPTLGRLATGGGNMSLPLAFETINHRVGLLELQMLSEFGYQRRLPRGEIEMTGHAVTPRGAPVSSTVNRGVAYP